MDLSAALADVRQKISECELELAAGQEMFALGEKHLAAFEASASRREAEASADKVRALREYSARMSATVEKTKERLAMLNMLAALAERAERA